jgi:hypothetical protein
LSLHSNLLYAKLQSIGSTRLITLSSAIKLNNSSFPSCIAVDAISAPIYDQIAFRFFEEGRSQPMRIPPAVILCIITMLPKSAFAQSSTLEPIRVSPGTVLTFHLQTRLNPGAGNDVDVLPSGTTLHVKILDSIDSNVDRDGAEFHGLIVSSVAVGKVTVLHSDAEVRGIFALLRSRNHPDGFRYELLVTRVTDHGKSYDLTASLNPSFRDNAEQPSPVSSSEIKGEHKDAVPAATKLAVPNSN